MFPMSKADLLLGEKRDLGPKTANQRHRRETMGRESPYGDSVNDSNQEGRCRVILVKRAPSL